MDDVLTLTNEKRRKETRVSYVSSIHGSTTDEKKKKKERIIPATQQLHSNNTVYCFLLMGDT